MNINTGGNARVDNLAVGKSWRNFLAEKKKSNLCQVVTESTACTSGATIMCTHLYLEKNPYVFKPYFSTILWSRTFSACLFLYLLVGVYKNPFLDACLEMDDCNFVAVICYNLEKGTDRVKQGMKNQAVHACWQQARRTARVWRMTERNFLNREFYKRTQKW